MADVKFDFTNKTVIVTGGAQGIGFTIARQFLEAGAKVSIWDYSEKALETAKSELSSFSARLQTLQVDVTDRASVASAAQTTFPNTDILINNAGITRDKSFAKMSDQEWDSVINTNLTGLFNVTKSLLEKFNSGSNHKRIVNISSVVGLFGNFGQTNYAAAKAGVIGMTRTWSKELGRKGFTVNAVAPGFIKTAMTNAMPPEVLQQMSSKVSVQRMGETSDIAQAVMFLSSESAAYINGTVISVDGGLTI
ncbi:MAG: 3-oxoacyl-ACP reductase [Pseudobdellovibrio sp.]|jgi:3-oxoacyl-[acyl-carrier protein] reductase|nr:3-oxoacyl-ACP reductase [Pseudobdellovibrio sp.]